MHNFEWVQKVHSTEMGSNSFSSSYILTDGMLKPVVTILGGGGREGHTFWNLVVGGDFFEFSKPIWNLIRKTLWWPKVVKRNT